MKLSRKKTRPRCFPKHVKDEMIRSCYQARDSAKPPKNVWEPGRTPLGFHWVPNVHSFVDCVKKFPAASLDVYLLFFFCWAGVVMFRRGQASIM